VKFTPYATVKDAFAMSLFMLMFAYFVFFNPEALGDVANNIPANPLQTPAEIVPEWYLLPFYAILRSITFDFLGIPAKTLGVAALAGAILLLFILPWLDTSKVRSLRYRPWMQLFFFVFVADCLALGWVGAHKPEGPVILVGEIATAYYFVHFLIIYPLVGFLETPRPMPDSISKSVLRGGAAAKA